MPRNDAVRSLVEQFEIPDDGAAIKSRELILLLLDCTSEPFSRAQFTPDYITATGLVLGSDGVKLLLVHHRLLDRWLLPGGHAETEDVAVWDTARREVLEETGAMLVLNSQPRLAGVDVHGIPSNRGEPYHLHHDLIFSFRALTETSVFPKNRGQCVGVRRTNLCVMMCR